MLSDAGPAQEFVNLENESFLKTYYFLLLQNCYKEPSLLEDDTLLSYARKLIINQHTNLHIYKANIFTSVTVTHSVSYCCIINI